MDIQRAIHTQRRAPLAAMADCHFRRHRVSRLMREEILLIRPLSRPKLILIHNVKTARW